MVGVDDSSLQAQSHGPSQMASSESQQPLCAVLRLLFIIFIYYLFIYLYIIYILFIFIFIYYFINLLFIFYIYYQMNRVNLRFFTW